MRSRPGSGNGEERWRRTAELDATRRTVKAELAHNSTFEKRLEDMVANVVPGGLMGAFAAPRPATMEDDLGDLLARRYGTTAEDSRRAAEADARIRRLVDDLLTAAGIPRGSSGRTWVDSGSAVTTAVDGLTSQLSESGGSVEIGPMPMVVADLLQLARLFQNLIGNALKYRSAAAPRIRITGEERRADWHFTVTDNGIGVEPADRERIFTPFQRLACRKTGESGCGLAVCRRIIEYHGGHIWVDSQAGHGCVFHFTLSKRPAAAPPVEAVN
jgi:light-regulated signal transduction histidine kinase (bacteriophytochrome)